MLTIVFEWENSYVWGTGQVSSLTILQLPPGASGLADLEHVKARGLLKGQHLIVTTSLILTSLKK